MLPGGARSDENVGAALRAAIGRLNRGLGITWALCEQEPRNLLGNQDISGIEGDKEIKAETEFALSSFQSSD